MARSSGFSKKFVVFYNARLRESSSRHPFRQVVGELLESPRFQEQVVKDVEIWRKVFEQLVSVALHGGKHPAVSHLDLMHGRIALGRGLQIKNWSEADWHELRKSSHASRQKIPLQEIYAEGLRQVRRELRHFAGANRLSLLKDSRNLFRVERKIV